MFFRHNFCAFDKNNNSKWVFNCQYHMWKLSLNTIKRRHFNKKELLHGKKIVEQFMNINVFVAQINRYLKQMRKEKSNRTKKRRGNSKFRWFSSFFVFDLCPRTMNGYNCLSYIWHNHRHTHSRTQHSALAHKSSKNCVQEIINVCPK